MEHIIIGPIMKLLDEDVKSQVNSLFLYIHDALRSNQTAY